MSFLNSVLSSIETGDKTSFGPPPASQKPPSSSVISAVKPAKYNPPIPANGINNGVKRKAGDALARPPGRPDKASRPSSARSTPQATTTPQKPAVSGSVSKSAARSTTKSTTPTPVAPRQAPVPSKPPPKGSFAAIMAQAKAIQTTKQSQVGLIRHQAAPKERMSKATRERMAKEAKQREIEGKKGRGPAIPSGAKDAAGRLNNGKSAGRSNEPEYKGTARRPPQSSAPAYTGTAGRPSKRAPGTGAAQKSKQTPHRAVRDEYLGTDEEDEGDYYGADDYDDYASDVSSDMEAGIMDVEREEQEALRAARAEDEAELRAEAEAKRAKEERKRKLAALSKSKR